MAVAKMKKVSILTLSSLRQDILDVLQNMASVQLINVHEDEALSEQLARVPVDSSDLERQLARARECLRFLGSFHKKSKGMLESFIGSKVTMTRQNFMEAIRDFDLDTLYATCSQVQKRLERIKQEQERLESYRTLIRPWQGLSIDLAELADTAYCRVTTGSLSKRDWASAHTALAGQMIHLEQVEQDDQLVYFVAITHRDDEEAQAALRQLGITTAALHEFCGTPRELMDSFTAGLAELAADEQQAVEEMNRLGPQLAKLQFHVDYLSGRRQALQANAEVGSTESAILVLAWCRQDDLEQLQQGLEGVSTAVALTAQDPDPDENVPVKLKNHPFIEPFEVVTNIYGFPSYREVDPTPLLAPFFFVLFGLALTDAGYGLLLMLLSSLALKKLDIPRSGTKLIRLLWIVGLSTVLAGALTGGWFGDLFDILPLGFLQTMRSTLTLFDPLENPLLLLGISLGLGVLQVWFGLIIKMYATFSEGRWLDGLFDRAAWIFLIPALGFMAVTMDNPALVGWGQGLVVAGAVWIMVGGARRQPNWLLKPFAGVLGLYDMVEYLSATLSYARIMALGLATGVIAMVVNQIAALGAEIPLVGILVAAVIIIGGHTFNLAINTLGSFIHSGRLQFVEFFTKFFEGSGRGFKPFRAETEFVNIEEY